MQLSLTLQKSLGDIKDLYDDFYQEHCEFQSEEKENHYESLGHLLAAFRDYGFEDVCFAGLPEFRALHILDAIQRCAKCDLTGFIGFEKNDEKWLEISQHYNELSKFLGFPLDIVQGDILEKLHYYKDYNLPAPNVFDFDFCEDTTAFKRDRDIVLAEFRDVPRYRHHVPNLLLAREINRVVEFCVGEGVVFAVGINFSARNVSSEAAEKFRDRIMEEVIGSFGAHAVKRTMYRPAHSKSGMVGAWMVLSKQ